jgi:tRNA:m4X modification enzyme
LGENEEKARESSARKRKLKAERSDGQVAALANNVISELEKTTADWSSCWTVEFGAGKGSLTKGIRKAVNNRLGGHVLVDRDRGFGGSNKRVADNEHLWTDDGCVRLRIDMANLHLAGLPQLQGKCMVGVGKHVCGAATDLALRCLVPSASSPTSATPSSGSSPTTVAVVIALCCYHRCSWDAYLNQEFVMQAGFSPIEFEQIIKITSWCHIRASEHTDSMAKARLANLCKRFIDAGRVMYFLQRGFKSTVAPFVDPSLTLENYAFLAHKE